MGGRSDQPAMNDTTPPLAASQRNEIARRGFNGGQLGVLALATLVLAGCSQATIDQLERLGLPEPASDRAPYVHDL